MHIVAPGSSANQTRPTPRPSALSAWPRVASTRGVASVCSAVGKGGGANERALQRYLRNRVKQLGTFVPPNPSDATAAAGSDTAVLWHFLSQQLEQGITNDAQVLRKQQDTAAASDAAGVTSKGEAKRAASGRANAVIIAPPSPLLDSARTLPLRAPWRTPAEDSVLDAALPPDARPLAAAPAVAAGNVYVFWDVESAHPGARDPRLAASELLRVVAGLRVGRLAGAYAYASREAWAWVPSHFVATYGSSGGGGARGGGGGGAKGGRVACAVCGQPVAVGELQAHVQRLHGGRSAQRPPAASSSSAPVSSSVAPRNTYRTGLGAVREYYTSAGVPYRPSAGHQLSLKYVVQREGFEPRVAQNADGASDRALNGGIDRLLAALRARAARAAGGGAGGRGPSECTLVVASGSGRHGAAFSACRQLGVRAVLVAPGGEDAGGRVGEAGGPRGVPDIVLDWEALADGRYAC